MEFAAKKFGKEVAEEGVETIAAKMVRLASKHGDEVVAAAFKKIGPRAGRIAGEAGEHGGLALRLLGKHGDEALTLTLKKTSLRTIEKYGDNAATALIRHGSVGEKLIGGFGREGVDALARVTPQNGRAWRCSPARGRLSRNCRRSSAPWRCRLRFHLAEQGAGDRHNVRCFSGESGRVHRRNEHAGDGREEGQYWRNTRKEFCSNAIVLLKHGHGRIGAREIYELVNSAPTSLKRKTRQNGGRTHFAVSSLWKPIGDVLRKSGKNSISPERSFLKHGPPTTRSPGRISAVLSLL